MIGETLTTTPGIERYHYTELYYPTRTWYSYTNSVPRSSPPPAGKPLAHWLFDRPRCTYAVTGQATIDGQSTLVLTAASRIPDGSCSGPTFWVSATTYQLVQTEEQGAYGTTTTDRQWLPRTPANIALTQLQVPAGFTESPTAPPFDPNAY